MRPGAARPPVEIQGRQCLPVASFRFPHSQDIRPGRASRRPRPCHGGNDEPQRFAPATIPGDGVGGAGERSPGGRPVIACRPASAPQARQGREGRTTGRGSPADAGARRARGERARIGAHRGRAARCGCLSRSHGAWGAARGRRAVPSERLFEGTARRGVQPALSSIPTVNPAVTHIWQAHIADEEVATGQQAGNLSASAVYLQGPAEFPSSREAVCAGFGVSCEICWILHSPFILSSLKANAPRKRPTGLWTARRSSCAPAAHRPVAGCTQGASAPFFP